MPDKKDVLHIAGAALDMLREAGTERGMHLCEAAACAVHLFCWVVTHEKAGYQLAIIAPDGVSVTPVHFKRKLHS